jgi:hypothetical protein
MGRHPGRLPGRIGRGDDDRHRLAVALRALTGIDGRTVIDMIEAGQR